VSERYKVVILHTSKIPVNAFFLMQDQNKMRKISGENQTRSKPNDQNPCDYLLSEIVVDIPINQQYVVVSLNSRLSWGPSRRWPAAVLRARCNFDSSTESIQPERQRLDWWELRQRSFTKGMVPCDICRVVGQRSVLLSSHFVFWRQESSPETLLSP